LHIIFPFSTTFVISLASFRYSQTDPECCGDRSANRGAVALVIPIPMEVWATDPTEREAQKRALAEKMIARADGYLPGFNASVDRSTMMLVSPYEAQQWMGSPVGTEMGYYANVKNMNFFDGVPQQATPIEALFQVGQFSFPGGGQPTVSQSGQTAAMMILSGINIPKTDTNNAEVEAWRPTEQ
jgi:phytoene dehydrogenase-like protein